MKSRPIFEVLVLLALFAAASGPLFRIASAGSRRAVQEIGPPSLRADLVSPGVLRAAETVRAHAALRFAHRPETASLETEGSQVLWRLEQWESQAAEGGLDFDAPIGGDGRIALRLKAAWGEETGATAVEIRLEPDAMPTMTRTIWAEGRMDEVVEFDPGGGGER